MKPRRFTQPEDTRSLLREALEIVGNIGRENCPRFLGSTFFTHFYDVSTRHFYSTAMTTLKEFVSPANGEKVYVNVSPDNFTFTRNVPIAEMRQYVADFERIRIDAIWTRFSRQSDTTTQVLNGWLTNPNGQLRYFNHARIQRLVGARSSHRIPMVIQQLTAQQQKALLENIRPSSYSDFRSTVAPHGAKSLYNFDIAKVLEGCDCAEMFIEHIAQILRGERDAPRGAIEPLLQFLAFLRGKAGLLLYPLKFHFWGISHKTKWTAPLNEAYAGRDLSAMLHHIDAHLVNKQGERSVRTTLGLQMVLMTSATNPSHLPPIVVQEVENLVRAEVRLRAPAKSSGYRKLREGNSLTSAQALRLLWNEENPEHAVLETRTSLVRTDDYLHRTGGRFGWIEKKDVRMNGWIEPLSMFVAQRASTTKAAVITDLCKLLDFLLAHSVTAERPEDVVRHIHILDVTGANANTLMRHLSSSNLDTKRRNRLLRYAEDFFDWYGDFLRSTGSQDSAARYTNPVARGDKFKGSNGEGHTLRTAIPAWVMRELRKTLTANEYEFAKTASSTDHVRARNNATGKTELVWWPGIAMSLEILYDLPFRSHQARWLDSGEYDEHIYDADSDSFVKNTSSYAIKGRRQGLLREQTDNFGVERWVGGYVNTNKTGAYLKGGSDFGYDLPFIPDEARKVFIRMSEWNATYLQPLPGLVTYKNEASGRTAYAQAPLAELPKIAPLFRDPTTQQRLTPVSRDKIARLHTRVLKRTEERIFEERGQRVPLTRVTAKGEVVWLYDLHTLRVSGITAMLEAGVPVEIVQRAFAGHSTLVMTLHYFNPGPAALRDKARQMWQMAKEDQDFVGSAAFVESLESLSSTLLSKHGHLRHDDGDAAFAALQQHKGLWTVTTSGICPGTSCSSGGEKEAAGVEYGAVPGGRRCGLCRYWVTGPAFLVGQIAEGNAMLYRIAKAGRELRDLRNKRIELEDQKKWKELKDVDTLLENMDRELTLDVSEWAKRFAYAKASSEMLVQYQKLKAEASIGVAKEEGQDRPLVPMLTSSDADDWKMTLQETDSFTQLEHVTQFAEFRTSFKSQEPILEKQKIMSQILVRNDISPFVLTCPEEVAEQATNLLSSVLLAHVKSQDIARLASGEIFLPKGSPVRSDVKKVEKLVNSNSKLTEIPVSVA